MLFARSDIMLALITDSLKKKFLCFSILISAFVGTSIAFACFSGSAMLAKRREYLYLSGLLSSGVSILLWLDFASFLFGGSTAIFKFEVRDYWHAYLCHLFSWFSKLKLLYLKFVNLLYFM